MTIKTVSDGAPRGSKAAADLEGRLIEGVTAVHGPGWSRRTWPNGRVDVVRRIWRAEGMFMRAHQG
jgi:hypothetical protein